MIHNLENDSLLLIDELCRSTYFLEGFALSLAICDYFLNTVLQTEKISNTYFAFATHFRHLAYLKCYYSKIDCQLIEPDDEENECKIFQQGIFILGNFIRSQSEL